MSPSISLNPECLSNGSMFSILPVEKLSKQTTSFPNYTNFSQRFDPINPAPPVTNILAFDIIVYLANYISYKH